MSVFPGPCTCGDCILCGAFSSVSYDCDCCIDTEPAREGEEAG